MPSSSADTGPIGPEAKAYLDQRFRREREHVARQLDAHLETLMQRPPDLAIRRLQEHVAQLERQVGALQDNQRRVHAHPRDWVPPKRRDEKGRLKDDLLLSVASVFADGHWTKTELANELGVHVRTLTSWLQRKKAPRDAATRDALRAWIARNYRDPDT
ncbi:MAG: hypothetical protein WC326_15435 [Candidatus Delongbacteria bacterium]